MDIFDRLGTLIRSYMVGESQTRPEGRTTGTADPDFTSAWEELDEFLHGKTERVGRKTSGTHGRATQSGSVPAELEQDFRNLEVPVGAPFEQVRESYRRLIVVYHPDRYATNPRKHQLATEITKKLNYSYSRLERYSKNGN